MSLSTEKCIQLVRQSNTTQCCPKIETGYCVHELCSRWPTKNAFKSLCFTLLYLLSIDICIISIWGKKWRKIIKHTVMMNTLWHDVYCVALIKGAAFYVRKQKGELIIP